MTGDLAEIIDGYMPISLEEMGSVRLMNRTDTKFVTSESVLSRLLEMAMGEYFIQEIGAKRVADYYTLYFDTSDCIMFTRHQCGKRARQKLRIRSYVDSNLSFSR